VFVVVVRDKHAQVEFCTRNQVWQWAPVRLCL
jgi:hypothetical protein